MTVPKHPPMSSASRYQQAKSQHITIGNYAKLVPANKLLNALHRDLHQLGVDDILAQRGWSFCEYDPEAHVKVMYVPDEPLQGKIDYLIEVRDHLQDEINRKEGDILKAVQSEKRALDKAYERKLALAKAEDTIKSQEAELKAQKAKNVELEAQLRDALGSPNETDSAEPILVKPKSKPQTKYLTAQQFAEANDVSVSTITRKCRSGQILGAHQPEGYNTPWQIPAGTPYSPIRKRRR